MSLGRPLPALILAPEEREELAGFAASRSLPHALVSRAQLVLWAAEGLSNQAIGERLGWSKPTVGKWRQRFVQYRLQGLYDELRAGRPRSISDEQVAVLLRRTLKQKPAGATHWSVRLAAEANGLSKSTVHRVFQLFALQPHRSKSFKLSTDPFFVEKVRDVVGLYLNPPDHAVVLSVDEKSQIQALNRTQPVLPMGLGYVEGITTIMSATEPPRYLRRSISPPQPCSPSVSHTTGIRSSWASSSASTRPCPRPSTSTSSSTTTPLISTPRCASGWPQGHASTSTTRPPTPHGSIRSSAGSDSSPNRPSDVEVSKALRTSSPRSTASHKTTTNTAGPSRGLPPQIPSSKNSQNYVHVFLGQNTRQLYVSSPYSQNASRRPLAT
jgi:transposase